MSHLFADIFDGIRFLRILKGVPEKDILDYVQSRVGNMKVGNVLKTIRTLRKLVEEGILVKKGKRYSLSGKCPKAECYDSEEDTQGDDECDGEEDEKSLEDCEEEEEGEEDDEDEEDDFDDDDDDDMCNSKNNESKGNGNNTGTNSDTGEETYKKEKRSTSDAKTDNNNLGSKESFVIKPKVGDEGNKTKTDSAINSSGKNTGVTADDPAPVAPQTEVQKKKGHKKKRNFLERKATKRKSKSQESAFCARDFIDSLEDGTRENFNAMDMAIDSPESREKLQKFIRKHRGTCLRREHELRTTYRSRSPVTSRKRQFHEGINKEDSVELGSSNTLFQDPVDAEVVVEENKAGSPEGEIKGINPGEGSTIEITDLEPSKPEASSSSIQVLKREPSVEECTVTSIPQNKAALGGIVQRPWMGAADKRQERTKRGFSGVDDRGCRVNRSESLCSVCDKKRRNS